MFLSIFTLLLLFICLQCGLACHKKCLATLAIRCGNKVHVGTHSISVDAQCSVVGHGTPLLQATYRGSIYT